jgi:predicted transcriptional regulator
VQRCLAEHGIRRERNAIAKRLQELEAKSLVERIGREYDRGTTRTRWRRTP